MPLMPFWSIAPFCSPWKLKKNSFSGIFKGCEMRTLAGNELDQREISEIIIHTCAIEKQAGLK